MPLDRHAQRFLKMLALSGPPAIIDAAKRRRDLEALRHVGEGDPEPGVATCDISIETPAGGVGARLYVPKGLQEPSPALVYLHGGGWVAGDLETHDGVCRRLALASGCKIVAVDYRRAPEHPFPAALEDAAAVLAWTAREARSLGFDPARIALGGDSAGANIAAAAVVAGGARPAALLLVCPILDIARESASRKAYAEGYFLDRTTMAADLVDYLPPNTDRRDPRLSPLLAEDLSGLPPTLIHSAEFDPFRDEAAAFASHLAEVGVLVRHTEHAGMIHYFYALPRAIPHALVAAQSIGAELKALLEA